MANALKQSHQFFDGQLHIAQDDSQQAGTYRLAGMNGHSRDPAIRVLEKDVTSAAPVDVKSRSLECADELFSLEAWKAGHTETC